MPKDRSKEREAVKKAYQSKKWDTRVDNWNDAQVYAVYLRLKKQNKIL